MIGGSLPLSARADDCPKAARLLGEAKALGDSDPQTSSEKETKIRQAIADCSGLADAHFQLGKLLFAAEKFGDARDSFGQAAKQGKDARYSLAMAHAEVALGNAGAAEKIYQEVLSTDDSLVGAYSGIAGAFRAQNKLADAEGALRRGIQSAPKDPDLFFNLGVVLEDQQKTEEAADAYRAALERRKPFTDASIYLARAEGKLGHFDKAYEIARAAALSEPDNAELRVTEAVLLDGMGRYDEALARLDAALAGGVQSVSVRVNRVIALGKLNRLDEAASEVEKLNKAYPDSPEVLSTQGWVLLQRGELELAEQVLRRAIELGTLPAAAGTGGQAGRPALASSFRNLGVVLERKGDAAGAASAMQKSADLDPYGVLSKMAADRSAK